MHFGERKRKLLGNVCSQLFALQGDDLIHSAKNRATSTATAKKNSIAPMRLIYNRKRYIFLCESIIALTYGIIFVTCIDDDLRQMQRELSSLLTEDMVRINLKLCHTKLNISSFILFSPK